MPSGPWNFSPVNRPTIMARRATSQNTTHRSSSTLAPNHLLEKKKETFLQNNNIQTHQAHAKPPRIRLPEKSRWGQNKTKLTGVTLPEEILEICTTTHKKRPSAKRQDPRKGKKKKAKTTVATGGESSDHGIPPALEVPVDLLDGRRVVRRPPGPAVHGNRENPSPRLPLLPRTKATNGRKEGRRRSAGGGESGEGNRRAV